MLASGLYPEVFSPANRHRSLVVGLLFDAGCHLQSHVLTERGVGDGVDEVLPRVFPAAHRRGWQVAGIADVGPSTFEIGAPEIIWSVEREPR